LEPSRLKVTIKETMEKEKNKVDKRLTKWLSMAPKEPKIKPLTNAEKEVFRLITEEFLTLKQIKIRRQCSRQAVYKILKNLKEKGALDLGCQKVDKIEALVNQRPIRLHGQEFNIRILFQNEKYQSTLKTSNLIHLNGHTIKLYRNSIEIYAGEGISFYGDSASQALSKSLVYWKKFITSLEHEFKVILLKPRARNIRIVNQHFAKGNSEICDNAINNHKRIKVFAVEDGKLAFITDDSFGFREDETVHPQTSKPDREAVDKQVNDWRTNNPPTNSQLTQHISQITTNVSQNTQNLNNYAVHLKAHIKSVQDLGEGITTMVKQIAKLTKIIRGLKD